jgi:hypothetical protein
MEFSEPINEPEGVPTVGTPAPEPSDPATETGFRCYICGEPSTEICPRCTRDTCDNHICERCVLCSDCCTCGDGPR